MSLVKYHETSTIMIEITPITLPQILSCLFAVNFHPFPCWTLENTDLLSFFFFYYYFLFFN